MSILGEPEAVSREARSKPNSKIGADESLREFARQPLGCDSLRPVPRSNLMLAFDGHTNDFSGH